VSGERDLRQSRSRITMVNGFTPRGCGPQHREEGQAHDHHDCGAHAPPGLKQHLIPGRAGASLESAITVTFKSVTMRPICGRDELELFCTLPYVLNDEIADDLDAGRRRPEWMWVALDDDRVIARAVW
jgi:hypothetical protein